MLVYVSEQAQRDIQHYNLADRLRRFREVTERESSNVAFARARHKRPPYLIQQWAYFFRVFCRAHVHRGVEVLIIGRVVNRGDENQYLDLHAAFVRGEFEIPLPDEAALEAWIRDQGALPPELPTLPDDYQAWLRPTGGWRDDPVVYDSLNWDEAKASPLLAPRTQDLHQLVRQIIEEPQLGHPYDTRAGCVLHAEERFREDRPIWVDYVQFIEPETGRSIIFLLNAGLGGGDGAVGAPPEVIDCLGAIRAAEDPEIVDALAAAAVRSYPAYAVLDYDLWYAIQQDTETNLALSAEEERLLWSVSRGGEEGSLPAFINGRAGSGKSTMLFHQFARYVERKLRGSWPGMPIFLTYSPRLRDTAREAVRRLLIGNADLNIELEQLPDYFEALFWSFRDFLRGHIDDSEQRFRDDRYVDFDRFRRLYENVRLSPDEAGARCRLVQRPYSADMCWHAIRTYVKGYFDDEDMTPEDYNEIERGDRSISREAFRHIHDTVWHTWYRELRAQGWWDDLDLVRAALREADFGEGFAAIFYDETQDLTRAEMLLLLQMSLYARHDMAGTHPQSLPFMLAGDPYQCINPTGFRWETITSEFHQTILLPLVRGATSGGHDGALATLRLRPLDLQYNYRSAPSLVRAANLILLWRRSIHGDRAVRPQHSWCREGGCRPAVWRLGIEMTDNQFIEQAANQNIIVPADGDASAQFIEGDDLLRLLANHERLGNWLYTPFQAKGLEQEQVVLYKFGEYCPEDLWAIDDDNEDRRLVAQYFLNKLYVAMTRAKTQLYIVDTPAGYERLWSRATPEAVSELLGQMDEVGQELWHDLVAAIPLGRGGLRGRTEDEVRREAAELERQGRLMGDPGVLRRAAGIFRELGMERDGLRIEAEALQLEQNWGEAGRLYVQLERTDMAKQMFWQGRYWQELVAVLGGAMDAEGDDALRLLVARYMLGDPNIAATAEFCAELHPSRLEVVPRPSPQWRAVMSRVEETVAGAPEDSLTARDWDTIAQTLGRFRDAGHDYLPADTVARALARAGNFSGARRVLEGAGIDAGDLYWRVRAREEGLPRGLPWLAQISQAEVVSAWEQAGAREGAWSPEWLLHVAPALSKQGRHELACLAFTELGQAESAEQSLWSWAGDAEEAPEGWAHAFPSVVQAWVRAGEFGRAIDLCDHPRARRLLSESALRAAKGGVIREIARGRYKPSGPESARRKVETFVAAFFDLPDRGWRPYLTPTEMGAAAERTGGIQVSLRIYQGMLDGRGLDEREQEHLRSRWIVVKNREIAWRRAQGLPADRSVAELRRLADGWALDPNLTTPEMPRLINEPIVRTEPLRSEIALPNGVRLYQLPDYEMKIDPAQMIIRLEDRDYQTIVISAERGPTGGSLAAEGPDDDGKRRTYRVPAIALTIELWEEGGHANIRVVSPNSQARISF